jgi:hypothetical protein
MLPAMLRATKYMRFMFYLLNFMFFFAFISFYQSRLRINMVVIPVVVYVPQSDKPDYVRLQRDDGNIANKERDLCSLQQQRLVHNQTGCRFLTDRLEFKERARVACMA